MDDYARAMTPSTLLLLYLGFSVALALAIIAIVAHALFRKHSEEDEE